MKMVTMKNRTAFRSLSVSLSVFLSGLMLTVSMVPAVPARQTSPQETGGKPKTSTEVRKDDGAKPESAPESTDLAAGVQDATSQPAASVKAQDPATPLGTYSVVSSIEFGVRGVAINGNGNKFRSDLNYDPGFRIFDASLNMQSINGGGLLFDQLMVNSFGWGTDPNRYLRVNTEKTSLYKFDANYRRVDYFNSLTNFAAPAPIPNSQHTANTEYRQGDFDLTLWPAREKFRLNLGYSLSRNSGHSVFTSRYSSDEFPVLTPVRAAADDYRIGFDSKLWVFDLSFLQGWRIYKEDTTYFIDETQAGNNTINKTIINTFQRDMPTRGEMPYTRFSLHTFLANRVDFTGRYIYSSANTNYTLKETLTGTESTGNRVDLDAITASGNTKRPNAIGDLAATVFVTDRFRVSDTFRVQTFRINGGDIFNQIAEKTRFTPGGEVPLPVIPVNTMSFRFTNYRRYQNTLEADYDFSSRLSVHLGYRYTNRHVELRPLDVVVGLPAPEAELEKFKNTTDTFILGFKAKPVRIWSLYFDVERGENDNVFTRTANYDYTNFRVRNIIRPTRTITLNASLTTRDNTNPTVTPELKEFGADINTRILSTSADWSPNERLNLSGGYTYFHVSSEASVVFFLGLTPNLPVEGLARYFMKDNFAFMTAYWELHPRFRVYAGYRIHNDRGQGDRQSTQTVIVNSFPYQLQSPEVKFSVRLHRNVDWIAGYQYYDYKEKFVNNQFYQTHLPYTSLRIHFDRGE
jgi:hypothetical protein